MYMERIRVETAREPEPRRAQQPEPSGSALVGAAMLVIALPYWAVRLLGHLLWQDVKRLGHVMRLVGTVAADEARRR